jgi:hypothetical protein
VSSLKATLDVVEAGIREYDNGDGRPLKWELRCADRCQLFELKHFKTLFSLKISKILTEINILSWVTPIIPLLAVTPLPIAVRLRKI